MLIAHRLPVSSRASRGLASLIALLFFLAALTPQAAWAQGLEGRLNQLLEQAEEDYEMLMLDEAQAALEEAVDLAEREGLKSETLAKVFMMLGIVRHAAQNDSLAEDAFVQAIETYPDVEINPFYRTPAIENLVENARKKAKPPAQSSTPEPSPKAEEELEHMTHEPIRRTRAAEPLLVEARVPEHLPVFRVYLYHRRYGETDFAEEEMLPRDSVNFAVTLDSGAIRTSQLEYFIVGISRSGEPIAESGRRTNPHRVSILGDAIAQGPADPPPTDGGDLTPTAPESERKASGFYAFLAGGTDIGFLPGGTPPTANRHRNVSPGIAPAFGHAYLDLGWRITEQNNLGLYFRWQFAPGQDFSIFPEGHFEGQFGENPAFWEHQDECFGIGIGGDCLLGLKYERVISAYSSGPQFYSSIGMGIGRVRNWLRIAELASSPACMGRDILSGPSGSYCYLRDTVRTGWAHFRLGGGVFYPLHPMLDIVADTYLMVLLPDTSVNLDVNLGLRLRL